VTRLAVSGSSVLTRDRPSEMPGHYLGKPVFSFTFFVVELSTIELNQRIVIQWNIEKRIILMTPEQTVQLINLLSSKRKEANLSVNEVARRAEVDPGTAWRIEQGMIPTPKAESLKAIGKVLGIPTIDLFAVVGWIPDDDLPSIGPYLRAKYPQLPEEAVREIETNFEAVARTHGVTIDDSNQSRLTPTKES
jgi:transcriptional regulator with XRE-family HTH domain